MLRGALAVYVLLGHCRWLLWAGHSQWMAQPHAIWLEPIVFASATLKFGREAVMIFFVLSGFFIHLRSADQRPLTEAKVPARRFYARRAHRLGAPYAFALLVTVTFDLVGRAWFPTLYAAATGDPLLDGIFSRTGYSWESVAPALVALPSSLGFDFGTNGPLWSLAYEVVYYALYPAWFAVRRRRPFLAFGVVPAVCLATALLAEQPFAISVLAHYPVWLAGAALAELWSTKTMPAATRVMALAIFAAGMLLRVLTGSTLLSVVSAIVFGGAAVWGVAALGNAGAASRAGRVLESLGIRSYTIYIVHFPIVALFSASVIELQGGRPMHGWFAVWGAAAVVAISWLLFEVCEKHFVHHRMPRTHPAA